MSIRLIPGYPPEPVIVPRAVASVSGRLKAMLADGAEEIELPDMSRAALVKVMDFCAHHVDNPMADIPRPVDRNLPMAAVQDPWDVAFMPATYPECGALYLHAIGMDIPSLGLLMVFRMATFLYGKTVQELAEITGNTLPTDPEFVAWKAREDRFVVGD